MQTFALSAVGLSLILLQGCGGAGSVDPCPTPEPTPVGCVDSSEVQDLYPLTYPAVANTMYFAAKPGVVVSAALAMEVVYWTPNGPTNTEIGDPVVSVTGNVPSYVLPLPAGYTDVYESQNLPLPYNFIISVNLVDTRNPAICSLVWIAGFNTEPPDGMRQR